MQCEQAGEGCVSVVNWAEGLHDCLGLDLPFLSYRDRLVKVEEEMPDVVRRALHPPRPSVDVEAIDADGLEHARELPRRRQLCTCTCT